MAKNSSLALFRDVIAFYSENHAKQVCTLFEQDTEFWNFKAGGAYSYHCAKELTNVNTCFHRKRRLDLLLIRFWYFYFHCVGSTANKIL